MSKTHYETLNVPPDASSADIKRAYRVRANVAHPDKGGTAAEFAPIAKAYKVLSDPERRMLYDATGKDARPPIEVEVQNALMQGFQAALASEEDVEVIAFVREGIETTTKRFLSQIKTLKVRQKKLTAKRGKLKSSGVNVAHLVIDAELKNIEAQIANLTHQSEVSKACLKALKEYSEEWEAPIPTAYEAAIIRMTADILRQRPYPFGASR